MTAPCNQRYHPASQKNFFDLYIFAQHWRRELSDDLWSSLRQAATRLAAVSTEVPPPLATGKPSSSWFNVCASYHAIQVNHIVFFSHHLLHMDSLQQIPCIEWNKGQRPWQFFLHAEQQWGNPSSHNHWSQCPQVPTPSHIETLLWGCRTSARKGQHEQYIMDNGST